MTKCPKLTRINLDELLRQRRMIAVAWAIDDVQWVRTDLSADQAWDVLQEVERTYDNGDGITWDTLRDVAEELFGSGGAQRIERCDKALDAYNDDLPDSNLIDFLADAMHWCKAKVHDFDAKLAMARTHFDAETPSA